MRQAIADDPMSHSRGIDLRKNGPQSMHPSSIYSDPGTMDTPLRAPAHTMPHPASHGQANISYDMSGHNLSVMDTPMRQPPAQHRGHHSWDDTQIRHMGGPPTTQHMLDDTPMRQGYATPPPPHMVHSSPVMQGPPTRQVPATSMYGHNMTAGMYGTPSRSPASAYGQSPVDTPLQNRHSAYGYILDDTPMRHPLESVTTSLSGFQLPAYHGAAHLSGVPSSAVPDTPLRDMVRSMNPSETFYSPPYQPKSPPERDIAHTRASILSPSSIDTPMRLEPNAISRHGTADSHPHTMSRHGMSDITDKPLDLSGSKLHVATPYALSDEAARSPTKPYKLTTPYGTAENELSVAPTSISLSNAMDVIRNSILQNQSEPSPANLAFSSLPQTYPVMTAAVQGQSGTTLLTTQQQPLLPSAQPPFSAPSDAPNDIENALNDIGLSSSGSKSMLPSAATAAPTTPVKMETSMDSPKLRKQISQDSDDKASLHSYGSGT